jgi:hypothetical protein
MVELIKANASTLRKLKTMLRAAHVPGSQYYCVGILIS